MSRFAHIFINSTWLDLQPECQVVEEVLLYFDNLAKAIKWSAR